MCGEYSNATFTWTPGVCYGLMNITLNEGTFHAVSEPLRACKGISSTVTGLLVGTFLLAIIRILLQLVWYRRCDVKRDQGMMICCSNRDIRCACVYCMTHVALVHVAPTGKKGLNLWLNAIPMPVTYVIFNHYDQNCRAHMNIYSLIVDNLTAVETNAVSELAGLQALTDDELPPEWGWAVLLSARLVLISCAPPWISNLEISLAYSTLCHAAAQTSWSSSLSSSSLPRSTLCS